MEPTGDEDDTNSKAAKKREDICEMATTKRNEGLLRWHLHLEHCNYRETNWWYQDAMTCHWTHKKDIE